MTEPTENRLKNSASPYLRSAAHQPIDWNEWGEEAFQKARAEGKPVLLDIGAVWCHWCHVIDRESYENPEIAAIINELYIPVKVDRDERPDVDARYQSAISAISGQGGWPLTAFLTPDGKPFYGGTYFPPEDAGNRPGFRRVLLAISEAFKTRRAEIDNTANALAEAVGKGEVFQDARGIFSADVIDTVIESALRQFDDQHGGFGNSPKFPHSSAVDLLLEAYQGTREARLLHVAERTLEGMALGGVYDQVGGGFHRYSVDERWCVPHFEKMTYDNSELLKNFLHGYQVTGRPLFRATAEGIIEWVTEVLSDRARGGFYSSQDADQTLHDDGDYFTWTVAEARAVLSPEEWRAVEIYYDIGPHGEMHHDPERNVLWIAATTEDLAKKLGMDETGARLLIARAKGKMLAARRERRPIPMVDETLYVGWNAMFISAYLDAARALKREDCRAFALKTLDRILAEGWDQSTGFLHRVGGPRLEGSLDDQVFATAALLDAYETTLDHRYFKTAERAMLLAIERFGDPEGGGFFDRAQDAAPMGGLEVRRKPLQDSPTPGGNSVAAIVLEPALRAYGRKALSRVGRKNSRSVHRPRAAVWTFCRDLRPSCPASRAPSRAGGSDWRRERPEGLGSRKSGQRGLSLWKGSPARYAGAACIGRAPGRARPRRCPISDAAVSQAFVCVETTCHPPVSDPNELKALLAGVAAAAQAYRRLTKPRREVQMRKIAVLR